LRAVPRLCGFYPGSCFTTEEKARKNLSQGSGHAYVGCVGVESRYVTSVDFQLEAQNSNLFTYNTFIKILYVFRALP